MEINGDRSLTYVNDSISRINDQSSCSSLRCIGLKYFRRVATTILGALLSLHCLRQISGAELAQLPTLAPVLSYVCRDGRRRSLFLTANDTVPRRQVRELDSGNGRRREALGRLAQVLSGLPAVPTLGNACS
jgi:hypothetical protein